MKSLSCYGVTNAATKNGRLREDFAELEGSRMKSSGKLGEHLQPRDGGDDTKGAGKNLGWRGEV
jgi:hypothetical protein